jgi:hypothetical protein
MDKTQWQNMNSKRSGAMLLRPKATRCSLAQARHIAQARYIALARHIALVIIALLRFKFMFHRCFAHLFVFVFETICSSRYKQFFFLCNFHFLWLLDFYRLRVVKLGCRTKLYGRISGCFHE